MSQRNSEVAQPVAPELSHLIRREISRLQRRLTAIARDVSREAEGIALQRQAELFVRSKLPGRGHGELQTLDYSTDPPALVTASVDPAVDPRVQVEMWFKTARRYLRGAALGRTRAEESRATIAFLSSALALIEGKEIEQSHRDALLQDPRIARLQQGPRQASRTSQGTARRPFREFVGHEGRRIWVGRGARDNDELTTRVARPHDWFFHVQGATGAHVIVPRNRGEALPTELLLDAAHLAHHFSSLVTDEKVDVAYTERRFVQKRRNLPPGAVHLLRLKVLRLVKQRERVVRLIASEVRSAS